MSSIEHKAEIISQAFVGEPEAMQAFVTMISDDARVYASKMDGTVGLMNKAQFLQMAGEMYERSDSVRREGEAKALGEHLVVGQYISIQHTKTASVNAPFVMAFRFRDEEIVDIVELSDWRISEYLKNL